MLVAEWKQVPAAMFQHPVESLLRRVEAVIAAKGGDQLHINAHDFGMRYSTSTCPHNFGHVVCVCMNIQYPSKVWTHLLIQGFFIFTILYIVE